MKAVINEKETPKQPEYPMLMKATGSGRIVLFTSPTIGMVIHGEDTGIFHEKWATDAFTPFTGSITLSND